MLHHGKDMTARKEDFYISDFFGVREEFKIVSNDNNGKGTMAIQNLAC